MKLNKDIKNEFSIYPPPTKLKAFTLAEVLITLVVIGVIAAITVPSLLQSTQDKEFHSMYKKNFSVVSNALRRGQVEQGLIGDNTAIFTPSSDSNASYESLKRFAKYLNTVKICKNRSDDGCSELYYDIKYATAKEGTWNLNYPALVLADGTIYKVYQFEECLLSQQACIEDSVGNCLKDENGNIIPTTRVNEYCAILYMDVNGVKGPNKFGKDNYALRIYADKVSLSLWGPTGGQKGNDIFKNKD